MEMKPRQSHECEFSLMCETTFGKEIKPSTKSMKPLFRYGFNGW